MRYAGEFPRSRYTWKEIPGSSHRVILERILSQGSGLAVLDLGFGAGHLARKIRPMCRYLAGIELDPAAAEEGAQYFDDPLVDDLVEGLAAPFRERFDVVVAGDVLEHLPRPEEALRAFRPLLAPSGFLLCSLPNVANLTTRLALLGGRFDYADRGILDRTHLRFYTRRSGRQLLEGEGFRVLGSTPTAMPVELALPALGRAPLASLVRGAARLSARLWPTGFGYQFVHEAVPA